jgi:LAO/AO transport system kinase
MATHTLDQLLEKMSSGDSRALARLMTLVEREDERLGRILEVIGPRQGQACTLGITGPPGAGKSSLVDGLTTLMRQAGKTVGIVAIDPSSPFTGGALLGDRIRMTKHYLDRGVFIRSMATRGSHGGLSRATKDVIKLMDAASLDYILVETVGVGQTELDIMGTTDTVLVTLVPEAGDGVQVMKAGLMEIADIFVVNKADRDGSQRMMTELSLMLELKYSNRPADGSEPSAWRIPVLATQAINGTGLPELWQAIREHHQASLASGELARRRSERRREELIARVEYEVRKRLTAGARTDPELAHYFEAVGAGTLDPHTASHQILESAALRDEAGPSA